jgi:hypothetical protein
MQPGDTRWRVACKPGYYSDESAFIMLSSNSFKYDPEVADAQVSPGLEHPLAGSLEREISLPSLVVVGSARLTRHDWFQVTSLVIALPLDLYLACGRHVFPLRCRTLLREDRFGSRVWRPRCEGHLPLAPRSLCARRTPTRICIQRSGKPRSTASKPRSRLARCRNTQ